VPAENILFEILTLSPLRSCRGVLSPVTVEIDLAQWNSGYPPADPN